MNSKKDWWLTVENNWDNLLVIASDQLDLKHIAYDVAGDASSKILDRNTLQELIFLKKTKDAKIVRYFNAIWSLASDDYAVENKDGWSDLCDLCSESYLIEGGGMKIGEALEEIKEVE